MKDNCKKYQSFVFVSWQGLISNEFLYFIFIYKLFSIFIIINSFLLETGVWMKKNVESCLKKMFNGETRVIARFSKWFFWWILWWKASGRKQWFRGGNESLVGQELRRYLDVVPLEYTEDDFPETNHPRYGLRNFVRGTNLAMHRVYFRGFTGRNGSLVATYGRKANIPRHRFYLAWWESSK